MGLLFEAMNYHLLQPERKRIIQSPRTRPRCPPKVYLSKEFVFVLRNLVTLIIIAGSSSCWW